MYRNLSEDLLCKFYIGEESLKFQVASEISPKRNISGPVNIPTVILTECLSKVKYIRVIYFYRNSSTLDPTFF